jgi:peptidoglycan/xylan/chitin deacetylase (PgdA/CDA1 family)
LAGTALALASTVEPARWDGTDPARVSAQSAFDITSGASGCGQIAFLFNIGSGYAPATGMLNTLSTYGIPATMFIMGWLAEESPWLAQEIAGWGHPIGSHGYSPPELTVRSDDDIANDLAAAGNALSWALGYNPGPWFTPFAGASDERVRSIANSLGLVTVGWSVDSGDWVPGVSADSIHSAVVSSAFDGAIVELHLDAAGSADATASALPWIIEDLTAEGYQFVTVPTIAAGC